MAGAEREMWRAEAVAWLEEEEWLVTAHHREQHSPPLLHLPVFTDVAVLQPNDLPSSTSSSKEACNFSLTHRIDYNSTMVACRVTGRSNDAGAT
jgi:hypothetical protein